MQCSIEDKSKSLERKLERPDWKQWLPVYGIYQVKKDLFTDKPTIIYRVGGLRFFGSAVYQGVITGATIYGLYKLAEKLF